MEFKTNVMRKLDSLKLHYNSYEYETQEAVSGTEVAEMISQNPDKVFKTLVTIGKSNKNYVFMIPVACELDLKKAAAAVHEKAIEMIKSKDLLPVTGYIHGGCSPIGMKKTFPTVINKTAAGFDTIIFSAGKIGYQVEMPLDTLKKAIAFELADIIKS
jgi:Cys-tRNA(Pro)/Cys-tRNA(Cys) deacylase